MELIERAPTSADTNHHSRPQNPHKPKLLRVSKPVFAFSDLENFELLTTGALSHLPLDFIVNPLGVSERTPLLPIGSQGSHELSPVNHTVSVVKFVSDSIHFKLRRWELGLQDSIDEFVSRTVTITVVVQLAEEVLDTRLFVVVVFEVTLSPILPVEVLDLFKLLKVVKLVLQPPVALPCHHPDMPPFVPKGLGSRVLDAPFSLAHAGTASLPAVSWEAWSTSSVGCSTVARARTAYGAPG